MKAWIIATAVAAATAAATTVVAGCGGKTDLGTGSGGGHGSSGSGGGSGSGGSGGGPSSQLTSCLDSSPSPPACIQCLEGPCGSQTAALGMACSAYISCICPNGMFDQSAAQSCQSQEMQPACQSAITALAPCEEQQCAAACSVSGTGGGGAGSSSSSSSSSGG